MRSLDWQGKDHPWDNRTLGRENLGLAQGAKVRRESLGTGPDGLLARHGNKRGAGDTILHESGMERTGRSRREGMSWALAASY